MSPRRMLLTAPLLAAAVALVGCGGDTTKVVTVVAPPTESTPAATLTTQTLPSEGVAADPLPANLPGGVIAIQGRYAMRVVKVDSAIEITPEEQYNENEQRMWFAETTCDTGCRVELRRELPNGAYETVTLDPVAGDPTRYATEARVKTNFCLVEENRYSAARRRISVKVSATKDVAGTPVAIRLDGYIVVNQRCGGGDARPPIEKGSIQYRGRTAL